MKTVTGLLLLLAGLLATGCARSTLQTRKQERPDAYAALTADFKNAVDTGRIKVGMPPDAVYLAWGKPAEILTGESSKGATTTWLYHGTHLVSYRYWTQRNYCVGDRWYSAPYLEHDYLPRAYVRAEVVFENGIVKEWRSLPQPND
jgi:hypothetical protein